VSPVVPSIGDELRAWTDAGLLRTPRIIDSASAPEVVIDGRSVVLLCSNNYLGLADDHRLRSAAATAARRWGSGSGASRLVSGSARLHRDLEHALAAFEGTEDVVLFSSGYLANLGVLQALAGEGDAIFSDELNHASIVDGCRLSHASAVVYPHRDTGRLDALLGGTDARRKIVVTDTVFSMDGDVAPLDALVEVCARNDALLVVDEAHGTGVLGPHGAGAVDAFGLAGDVPVVVGTLSKALGSAGGYVATSSEIATLLRNRARTHVFDTAPAPAASAAALAALDIVGAEPQRRDRVRALASLLADELRSLGYEVAEPAAAIVPVLIGDAREAVELSERLLERGVFCPAIRPPSVAEGTSRLRVTVMATHTDEHIDRALDAFGGRTTTRTPPVRRDVFVTGTDTAVGKTVVTAAIARSLRASGLSVAIYKPLQTGTLDDDDDARDGSALSGCDAYTGTAFAEPLAPSVAAALDDVQIDVARLVATFEDLQRRYDAVVVEGAGGLLVPINDTTTMAELARIMRLPVVIVARPALGTLNHTALTVEVARSRGLHVEGIVISDFPSHPTLAERTNPSELQALCDAPLIGVVPHMETLDMTDASDWLGPRFAGRFDAAAFVASLRSAITI
jgi:8-amino-7-oxononanoate synthase/dethiobiotin synthase